MKDIKDDREVEENEVKEYIRKIDELGKQVTEVFQIGSGRGPTNNGKAYSNMNNKAGDIPEKDTMPKTHKEEDKDGHPKARGLVRAATSQNARVNKG